MLSINDIGSIDSESYTEAEQIPGLGPFSSLAGAWFQKIQAWFSVGSRDENIQSSIASFESIMLVVTRIQVSHRFWKSTSIDLGQC